MDGGAVVGAPRVRVPQLPRESVASFVSVWVGRTRTACSTCDLLHAFRSGDLEFCFVSVMLKSWVSSWRSTRPVDTLIMGSKLLSPFRDSLLLFQ